MQQPEQTTQPKQIKPQQPPPTEQLQQTERQATVAKHVSSSIKLVCQREPSEFDQGYEQSLRQAFNDLKKTKVCNADFQGGEARQESFNWKDVRLLPMAAAADGTIPEAFDVDSLTGNEGIKDHKSRAILVNCGR